MGSEKECKMQNFRILELVGMVMAAAAARMQPLVRKASSIPVGGWDDPSAQQGKHAGNGSNARTRREAAKRRNVLRHRRACRG